MLSTVPELPHQKTSILIESDNCSSQYKSAEHFYDLQYLADKHNRTVVRVYGIAGHGKGELDHVGGIAKIAIRRGINNGTYMEDSEDMVDFLRDKFQHKEDPTYIIKQIHCKTLETVRAEARAHETETIDGSSLFHVMVFNPG